VRVDSPTKDKGAFSDSFERHRRELQLHCYRMLGSYEESEDMVQETFLRAWRKRDDFSGEDAASFRAWLYRIATNACLDALRTRKRRVLPSHLGPGEDPPLPVKPAADLPWLQPYPDHLLEGIAPSEDQPEEAIVTRETIEIAFLAAIQLLPPKQRAVLILRDVLGWSAKETADLLEASVPSVNSALQRARGSMERNLPSHRQDWSPQPASADERALLQRFMDALEQHDTDAFAQLLHEDARATMPPTPSWHDGRDAIVWAVTRSNDPSSDLYMAGDWKLVPVGANMQCAVAGYLRTHGDTEFRAFAIDVLRFEDGKLAEITAFLASGAMEPGQEHLGIDMFAAFGLPPTL
jgi:RNA polymerase sigma-70 factor, ECF subfamily